MNFLDPTRAHPAREPVACLVVVRNRLYRELLAGWIAAAAGDGVIVRAEDHAGAEASWAKWMPDVIVLDFDGAKQAGLRLAREFLAQRPKGALVGIMRSPGSFAPPRWLAGRLVALIGRSASLPELAAAVDAVLRRTPPERRPYRAQRLSGRPLSLRESEVLRLIGDGLSSEGIAAELNLSLHTVATHRKRIAAKLGSKGNQLTRWAIMLRENGLAAEKR
jgi:DNA-binding NarL/FixJ family response regulator